MRPPSSARVAPGTWAYLAGLAAFTILTFRLATVIFNPGSADSLNNLDTARNLATGRGFTSNIVQQYFFPQTLPNLENIRPPGAPVLLSILYLLGGVHLHWHVLLNGLVVAITSLAIHELARRRWNTNAAGFCALSFLLATRFEMASYWSNNQMTLLTAGMLWAAECLPPGRRQTLVLVMISALGVWIKWTFCLSAGAISLLCLLRSGRQRLKEVVLYLILCGILVTPLALISYGANGSVAPPISSLRLAVRYGLEKSDRFVGHKQFCYYYQLGHVPGWQDIVKIHGLSGILAIEALDAKKVAKDLLLNNLPLTGLFLAGGVLLWRGGEKYRLLLLLATLAEPIAAGIMVFYQARFLWPCLPAMLLLAGEILVRGRWFWRLLAMCALGIFLLRAIVWWQVFFLEAQRPIPAWVESVTQHAQGQVVMTDFPWSVVWWTPSLAVVSPLTTRQDLLKVAERYKVAYYLHTGHVPLPAPFSPEDLEVVATAPNTPWNPQLWHPVRGWIKPSLYYPQAPWFLAQVHRPASRSDAPSVSP